MNRPNVPRVGDDAGALLASLYADHVKSFTNFEVAGVKFALLSLVHFDLEGNGANKAMVAEKERTLSPKVFLSKRYRGNHATGLCEARKYSAADEKLIGWLCYCRIFLQTLSHFLRLVQAMAEGVRKHMDAPSGNRSPNSEAEELCRQEIRDYNITNWSAFDEVTMRTDAWSSDEKREPLPHRHGGRGGKNASKAKAVVAQTVRQDLRPILGVFSRATLVTMESHLSIEAVLKTFSTPWHMDLCISLAGCATVCRDMFLHQRSRDVTFSNSSR